MEQKEKIVITKEEDDEMNIKYYRGDELVINMQTRPETENEIFTGFNGMFDEFKKLELRYPFTGKIVCVENNDGYKFTVGKIYYVNNGRFFDDKKTVWGNTVPVSLNELEKNGEYNQEGLRFIRVVE